MKKAPGAKTGKDQWVSKRIYDYIKEHFSGGLFSGLRKLYDQNRRPFFRIDVDHENTLYHLKFNSKGIMLKADAEPLMESDEEYLMS
jgi:hypothetical protein